MNLPVLVLAGGRGERMRPLTNVTPKCLLPVAGKPFAVRQIEWLHEQGLDNITFSVGYLGFQVQDVLGRSVKYTWATNCGIQQAIQWAEMSGPFYLLYGDVLPQYAAQKLYWRYGRCGRGVMGRCLQYYDTGFSLLMPDMTGIDFIDVPPSLEIGSPEGYAATWRYFGKTLP